jgi:hypothetical protein
VQRRAGRFKLTTVDLTNDAMPEKQFFFDRFFPSVISAFDIQLFRKTASAANIPGESSTQKKIRPFFL